MESLKHIQELQINTYCYEDGLVSFINYINEEQVPLHKPISISGEKNGIVVDIALQYTQSYSESVVSFVNNVKTVDGGSHEAGFKSGLTKAFNEYIKKNGLLKGNESLDGSDTREGFKHFFEQKISELTTKKDIQKKKEI